jgi:hypothetical protein
MKKTNKKPKAKVVKELASHFETELNQKLPVSIRPDGSVVYKDYYIKTKKNGNWALYDVRTRDQIDEFFLKTCALMGAKAYYQTNIEKFLEIKRLDSSYWANQCDNLVFRNNIKKVKDFERYLILLNRLEETELQMTHFKDEISRMFQWSFV